MVRRLGGGKLSHCSITLESLLTKPCFPRIKNGLSSRGWPYTEAPKRQTWFGFSSQFCLRLFSAQAEREGGKIWKPGCPKKTAWASADSSSLQSASWPHQVTSNNPPPPLRLFLLLLFTHKFGMSQMVVFWQEFIILLSNKRAFCDYWILYFAGGINKVGMKYSTKKVSLWKAESMMNTEKEKN